MAIFGPGEDEQERAQAIQVANNLGIHGCASFCQSHCRPLGSPHNSTGNIQGSTWCGFAGNNKLPRQLHGLLHVRNRFFQPVHPLGLELERVRSS